MDHRHNIRTKNFKLRNILSINDLGLGHGFLDVTPKDQVTK